MRGKREKARLALRNAWLEVGELCYYEIVHSSHVLLVGIALQPALMRRTLYCANEVASSVTFTPLVGSLLSLTARCRNLIETLWDFSKWGLFITRNKKITV